MKALDYRNALVTGASSGLGHALSKWLAARGVQVFAAARRADRLAALAEETADLGGSVVPVTMDVSDAGAAVTQIQQLWDDAGGLDLVIANAGVGGDTYAKTTTWEQVQRILAVNVSGAAATLTAVLPRMVERDRGHVVGVSSIAGCRGLPRHGVYSATKSFLTVFLEGLRVDLTDSAVSVTCIQPGFVKTELTQKNEFAMPFVIEAGRAAELMGAAIVRRKRVFTYPWQWGLLMPLAPLVPDAVFDALANRVKQS